MWDTAGQERFRSESFKPIRIVQGIILIFDFTNRNSFENLDTLLEQIKDNLNEDIVIVLFGNKIDIEKERWEVTSEEAKEFAQKKNLVLFETSAKENIGINEGFAYITNIVYLRLKKRKEKENKIILKQKLNKLLKYINL